MKRRIEIGAYKLPLAAIAALALMVTVVALKEPLWRPVVTKITGGTTTKAVVTEMEKNVLQRANYLDRINDYETFVILAIKQQRMLYVYGKKDGNWQRLKAYHFTAFSGKLGPKLREGDRQIPEGCYQITDLNPNSSYHLSLKLNYPNEFDTKMASQDGRSNPGSDIFIHGRNVTIGCIPIGDEGIEELFYLVDKAGKDRVQVIICPVDFRKNSFSTPSPAWANTLYKQLTKAISGLPL